MQTPCWTFSITLNQTFSLILAWTPWFSPWSLCTFSPFVCWFFSNYAIVYQLHQRLMGHYKLTLCVNVSVDGGLSEELTGVSPVNKVSLACWRWGQTSASFTINISFSLSFSSSYYVVLCVFFFLSTGAYTNLLDEFCQDKDWRKPRLRCRKVQGAQDEAELRTWKRP